MAHDATKVLMGTTQSSFRHVENHAGVIEAGLIVRKKSDDTISIAAADGSAIGISLGKSQSDTSRTAIVKSGTRVPVKLTAAFNPAIGAAVHISDTTGAAIAAGAGATAINAVYSSGRLTGLSEDSTEVGCAYIDMPGGV